MLRLLILTIAAAALLPAAAYAETKPITAPRKADLADRVEDALASARVPDCQEAAQPRGFAAQAPVKTPAAEPKAERNDCRSGYSPCVPIVADLDCPDVPGPVKVTGDDPYGLDRDGDGCDT